MNEIEILRPYLSDRRAEKIDSVLSRRTRDLCVVLDRFDKPHNYMAVLRTLEAFGIQDAHIIPMHGVSKSDISKSVTQGADKWLSIRIYPDWRKCFQVLRENAYKLYAACLSNEAASIEDISTTSKIALVFGNELDGLDPEETEACDGAFMLPMYGFSQSFNVSVACALSIQRLFIAREAAGHKWTGLSESEKNALKIEWYKKAVQNSEKLLNETRRRINPDSS